MTTRDRILTCALAELETRGLDGLSLRAAGVKAGITPMAVYRHFSDKADLLHAIGQHALGEWQKRIMPIEATSLRGWFRAVTDASIAFALDEPALYDAAFVLQTRAERVYPEDFRAGRSPVIGLLTAKLAEGQAAGIVRTGDPLELAMGVWGVLHGLIGLYRSGRFSLSRQDFTALCLRSAARIATTGEMV